MLLRICKIEGLTDQEELEVIEKATLIEGMIKKKNLDRQLAEYEKLRKKHG